jgi:glutamate synthase (NADPH/NADH) small chain
MADPKGFLKFKRVTGGRRPVPERLGDSREFELTLPTAKLREQGTRCMDCGVPFCEGTTGCPVKNRIPDWNDLVSVDRWEEAMRALHATNNFPEFTGKLCPAPCESACVLGINEDPVAIKNIELAIVERAFADGKIAPVLPRARSGKRVAVVGSGPAGLAAAQQLARAGHAVVVFEKADAIGGLLRYGIPDFKMEKAVLDRRLAQLTAEGVEFRTGQNIGKEISTADLRAQFDAVCLAVGAEKSRDLAVPGRNLPGVHFAMDYLIAQNRLVAGKIPVGQPIDARGKVVVILGGGDTGSDCLGTALRQGAREVHQFEVLPEPSETRSPTTPWPLWPMKLRTSHAHEEGGERVWSISTTEFFGDATGVKGLRAVQVRPSAKGFEPIPGSEIALKADLVLLALGFAGPVLTVDRAFQTGEPGVFAAGDATRGASLIVWAIAEGREMASAVHRYLSAGPIGQF